MVDRTATDIAQDAERRRARTALSGSAGVTRRSHGRGHLQDRARSSPQGWIALRFLTDRRRLRGHFARHRRSAPSTPPPKLGAACRLLGRAAPRKLRDGSQDGAAAAAYTGGLRQQIDQLLRQGWARAKTRLPHNSKTDGFPAGHRAESKRTGAFVRAVFVNCSTSWDKKANCF